MASGGEKKWNRPWSMEEMIDNAENWSMAGDVALLNTLKAYSENLFNRTVSISDNVNNLLHDLDGVSLKLNLSQNEFQSLRNTQFIESRVYEDDETQEFIEEVKAKKKVPSDEDKEKLMRESVLEGLRVMDKYFEKIEVSISDSEDEESDRSYVLRPVDLYTERPLPLVIGTEEWYKKWHVGLADSSSESESEKVSETYSESESGDDLPKDLIKGSETSSDLDFSSQTSENRPVANSTFNETSKRPDALASDEESDGQGSLPVKTPISSKSFAEQLAAKLGDVISEREDISSEINRNPIQPAQSSKFADVLFSDEPPPLDDLEDTILPRSAQDGLFSGGRGLFDDNEDDLFWGQQSKGPTVKPPSTTSEIKQESEEKTSKTVTVLPKTPQVSKDPFDTDTPSSDEDIFSAKPKKPAKQPFLQPYSTTAPLFDEEPPELEASKKPAEETPKKKPVGGVSIFDKPDIFSGGKPLDILKSRQQDSVDSKVNGNVGNVSSQRPDRSTEDTVKPKHGNLFDEDEDRGVETPPAPADRKPQKISLFDDEASKPEVSTKPKTSLFEDDDDLFKDDLFSSVGPKKLTSNLFDDFEENAEDIFTANVNKKVDLFGDLADAESKSVEEKTVEKPKKKLDLFDSENEEEEDLFAVGKTVSGSVGVKRDTEVSDQTVSADDEVDRSFVRTETVEELPSRQVIGAESLVEEKKTGRGLFDDSLEEEEDPEDIFKGLDVKKTQLSNNLFGEDNTSGVVACKSTVETQQSVEEKTKDTSELEATDSKQEKSQSRGTVNLFGSSPPPDDDDWDTKSVPSSDNDDQFYRVDYNAAGSSLFDNEPPSLGPNDSSGIVRDENLTRVDTDDSSFYPYASSSRRLSSDIFNEQQSQDSFFVTKNKSESVAAPLDKIPEAEKSSNLDITPSGRMEDFEDSKDSSSSVQDNSVFKNEPQSEPTSAKKTVSLFDDELNNSTDADDLFSSISKSNALPKLSEKRLSLFDNIDNVLKASTKKQNPSVKEKTETAKVEESFKDTERKEEKADSGKTVEIAKETDKKIVKAPEVDQKDSKKSPTVSPGKLKHNLKINVAALLPGSAPPKSRELAKSQSLDLPKEREATPTDLSSPEVGFFTPTVSSPPRNVSSGSSERAVSFEDALDNVEVLHSVTKDRARIPIKRRPSTRRGRQQAIQSGDFTLASGDNAAVDSPTATELKTEEKPTEAGFAKPSDLTPSPSEVKTPEFKTPTSEPFQSVFPGVRDKDDTIFPRASNEPTVGSEEKKTPDDSETVKRVHSNQKVDSFGEETLVGDDGLFGKSSSEDVGVFEPDKSKGSIFESEDSDSELFGQKGAKAAKSEGSVKKVAGAKKKSLFNDSSSDEDLFAGSTGGGSRRKENVQKSFERKPPKSSTTRKLENIETDEDPLSSLLK